MRRGIPGIILVLSLLVSCTSNPSRKFDRQVWLENNDVDDTGNPRAKMTQDLTDNYLKPGMTKDSILALLGPPYEDKIEGRLEDGVQLPDSLEVWKFTNEAKAVQDRKFKEFNDWMKEHRQPDTLLLYPVGWSTIDPNFLVIKFNDQGLVKKSWVEQH